MELHTTILRTDEFGDQVECDATVHFTAECTSPGYAATYMQPGDGPEFECTFESAELETRYCPVPGKLTEAELGTLRTWFQANTDKVWQAANDNFDDGPDPDEARDRAWDERGWRGLEAS
jgi:hypothetical protein